MKKIIFLLTTFVGYSCGKVQQVDTSDIKEIMRNSKPKRVTEKVLLDKVTSIGDSISLKLGGNLNVECQSIYEFDGYKVSMYNADLLSEKDFSDDIKGQLLEAFKYGVEHKQKLSRNVHTLNDSIFLYSFPLTETSHMKKICNQDFGLIDLKKSTIVKAL